MIWEPFAAYTTVYAKFPFTDANDTVKHEDFRAYNNRPNCGREGESWLYHIIHHWDDLQDIMIFAQAEPFDGLNSPATNTTSEMVQKALTVKDDEVRNFNQALVKTIADWDKINWNSSSESFWITTSEAETLAPVDYTMAEYFKFVIGEEHPPNIKALHGATFAVTRETIKKNSKAEYQRAHDRFEQCAQDPACCLNGEVGFFQERLWQPMFSKKYWLDENMCPYEE